MVSKGVPNTKKEEKGKERRKKITCSIADEEEMRLVWTLPRELVHK